MIGKGGIRLDGVPDGRYIFTAWHEMGDPVRTEITVAGAKRVELPDLVLTSSLGPDGVAGKGRSAVESAPVRPWADVIDRIGVTPGGQPRCRDAAGRARQGAPAGR